ncbi:MAG: tetratricopeptide repeat protein [bacterium]
MDAVSYPKPEVVKFIQQELVALRVPSDSKPLSVEFNVQWTPTLIVLDPEGKEHRRTLGFLPPEELIPSLMLGIAKIHFDQGRYAEALSKLERLLAEYPRSHSAAEAVYLRGVSGYKQSHDAKRLKEAYERLTAEYPSSEWAHRAAPYGLL